MHSSGQSRFRDFLNKSQYLARVAFPRVTRKLANWVHDLQRFPIFVAIPRECAVRRTSSDSPEFPYFLRFNAQAMVGLANRCGRAGNC